MFALLRNWTLAERSLGFKVVFVVVAFVVSLAVRYGLRGHLPTGFPYLTFFPAIILTTFFAGVRSGIVLGVLCGIAAWYFFIEPLSSFRLTGLSALALAFYAFIIATDIFLIHVMNEALAGLEAERERADALAKSRGMMFQELQHRVSNNLHVVSAMLMLQRRDIEDPTAQHALDVAAARLSTVARIQRSLHDPANQQIDFSRFLKEIVPDIVEASAAEDRVISSVDADPVPVSSEQSVPLALICTEFISNAVEHGLGDRARLTIRVLLKRVGTDRAVIEVVDDGPGLPEGFDTDQDRSLGLRIARQFAIQLNGHLALQSRNGTVARLEFPIANESAPDEGARPIQTAVSVAGT